MPDSTFDVSQLVTSVDTVPGYWQSGIRWSVLAPSNETSGAYSLMEQLMPKKSGPPPHVHEQGAEVFYILDGEMALQLGDHVVTGTAGQLVRIPAGTPHAFAVISDTARVLNFYVPASLDMEITMLGTPAAAAGLPPADLVTTPTAAQTKAFEDRLYELASQAWVEQADLLSAHRQ